MEMARSGLASCRNEVNWACRLENGRAARLEVMRVANWVFCLRTSCGVGWVLWIFCIDRNALADLGNQGSSFSIFTRMARVFSFPDLTEKCRKMQIAKIGEIDFADCRDYVS